MLLLAILGCSTSSEWASARQIDSLASTIGGPKATAREGDFLLENDRVRFAILDARYSMGPSPFGGTLADADLQRADPKYGAGHGNDQLAEMFATVNMNLVGADEPGEVTILADGKDGTAIVRATGQAEPFLTMLDLLWALVGQPEFQVTTDYVLEAGSPALKVVTTASLAAEFSEAEEVVGATGEGALPILDYAMVSGLAFGDFYLQGGSIDVFSPGGGFDEDRLVADAVNGGKNTFVDPFEFDFLAGVGNGVSYALMAEGGSLYVPLFTSSQTAAFGAGQQGTDDGTGDYDRFNGGKTYQYTRWFAVGKGDVGSAYDALVEARGLSHGTVRGFVVESGTGVPVSGASVLAFEKGSDKPYMQWESDVGDDTQVDGSWGGSLPPGDWELLVHMQGRPDGEKVSFSLAEGQVLETVLVAHRPGQVDVSVVDETGRLVPSKVTIFPADGDSPLVPDYGDTYLTGNAAEAVFLSHGEGTITLPPGKYRAVATRGTEYEVGESDTFTVSDSGVGKLNLQVVHSVDTDGWISADFHVHAANSFDSGVSLENRVITFAAEGVDFFTSSDHDYLTDFAPVVQDLDLEPWVKTAVGLETTTLEIGHFLAFPLGHDTIKEQGGAFDWTGMPPVDILAELETLGVEAGYSPMRFVAHPRDGILGYFDQYGFDPYTGEVSTPTLSIANAILKDPSKMTLDFEALELLNGKRFEILRTPTQPELDGYAATGQLSGYDMVERTGEEQLDLAADVYRLGYGHQGQIDDWFTLLNTGHPLVALGNSDTHSKFSIEAGCPRNYVFVGEEDNVASLDEQAVADAVKAGRVVASYGPFVRFTADEDYMLGDVVPVSDGSIDLHIEVEAPSWMSVDRVELYQNGVLIHEWEGLDPDVLKFSQELAIEVDKDSWFVVIAMGDDDLGPLFGPVDIPPVQLQDVVVEALSSVPSVGAFVSPAVPIPRDGPVLPFALTNPIWVDVDGDGKITPPGIPEFMRPPVEPE
ncbi:MAG: CehA/McbA family metallohydrolase [Deltaproteobacteria bacterium]|nr:CehA/McbA family metallohydrolase [Deltaproteobacteria bacterium]